MIQWLKKLFKKKPDPTIYEAWAKGGPIKPLPQHTPLPRRMPGEPVVIKKTSGVGQTTFKPVGPPNAVFGGYQHGAKEHISAKSNRVGLATAHQHTIAKTHDARRASTDDSDDLLTNALLIKALSDGFSSNNRPDPAPEPTPERGGYSGGGGASGSWDSGSSPSDCSPSPSDSGSSCSSD